MDGHLLKCIVMCVVLQVRAALFQETGWLFAVAALVVYRLDFIDMSMKGHVHMLYAVEGGRTLRAHSGTCYMYSDGAWRPFQGVLSEGVLSRMKATLLWVEGLFRTLPDQTLRNKAGLLAAIADSVARARSAGDDWIECMEHAGIGAWDSGHTKGGKGAMSRGNRAASVDHDVPGAGSSSWLSSLAAAIPKLSASVQRELLGKTLISYFVEWCDSRVKRAHGFAANDACFLFDVGGQLLVECPKRASNDIYLYIDHPLHDPVLQTAIGKLTGFLGSAFVRNESALQCHFAAIALALRGSNVDRAFWTIGAGGVGQSILSHLIAAVFGSSHSFIDMNIYFSDDEFRKQADALVGKMVVTGQEAPDTRSAMREDLYKKHMSGDPIACRLPYAVVTKQVELVGWKIFEMNSPLRFQSVTAETFNSIMRRSLVVELKGRFLSAEQMEEARERGAPLADNVLLKDPSFKSFVKSPQAVAAMWRVIEGYLCSTDRQTCVKIIDGYVDGGADAGLTDSVIREACGLPPRVVPAPPIGLLRAPVATTGGDAVAPTPGGGYRGFNASRFSRLCVEAAERIPDPLHAGT